MDENVFWLNVWRAAIAGICVVVATMAGCSSYRTGQVADLIRKGADPMEVGCAFDLGDNKTRCALLIAK